MDKNEEKIKNKLLQTEQKGSTHLKKGKVERQHDTSQCPTLFNKMLADSSFKTNHNTTNNLKITKACVQNHFFTAPLLIMLHN